MTGEMKMALAVVVAIAVGLLVYFLSSKSEGLVLDKDELHPTPRIDEGTVARIAVAAGDYGTYVHILLEEAPNDPIVLGFDATESAIALTQPGDRVRIEHGDEDEGEYDFRNLTTGLTARYE